MCLVTDSAFFALWHNSSPSWLLITNHATSLDLMNSVIWVGHRGNCVWVSRLASILQSDLHPISSFSWTVIILLHCLIKVLPSREKNMSENSTVGDENHLKRSLNAVTFRSPEDQGGLWKPGKRVASIIFPIGLNSNLDSLSYSSNCERAAGAYKWNVAYFHSLCLGSTLELLNMQVYNKCHSCIYHKQKQNTS